MNASRAHGSERDPGSRVLLALLAAVLFATALTGAGCGIQASERRDLKTRLDPAPARQSKLPAEDATASAGLETSAFPKVEAPGWPNLPETATAPRFSPERAMVHVRYLADELGVRKGGKRGGAPSGRVRLRPAQTPGIRAAHRGVRPAQRQPHAAT